AQLDQVIAQRELDVVFRRLGRRRRLRKQGRAHAFGSPATVSSDSRGTVPSGGTSFNCDSAAARRAAARAAAGSSAGLGGGASAGFVSETGISVSAGGGGTGAIDFCGC